MSLDNHGMEIRHRAPRKSRLRAKTDGEPTPLSLLVVSHRNAVNMAQKDLAAAWGRTQPFVSCVENGSVWNLSYMDAHALAHALGIDLTKVIEAMEATRVKLHSLKPGEVDQDQIPEEGSGATMQIRNGNLTRVESRVVESGLKDTGTKPNFRWAGVGLQPIDTSMIPIADDMEPSG